MIATLLRYYAVLLSFIESSTLQIIKTWQSIQDSFKSKKLLFLHTHSSGYKNLAVISSAFILNNEDIKNNWEWSYENGVFQQNGISLTCASKKKSLPWLSMSIFHVDGIQIDITLWLEKIVYFGERSPSLEIIIQAWSYDVGYKLKKLEDYHVKVINELADEEEHHLQKHA